MSVTSTPLQTPTFLPPPTLLCLPDVRPPLPASEKGKRRGDGWSLGTLGPHDPHSPSSFLPPRCGNSFIFPTVPGAQSTWREPAGAPEGQAQCSCFFCPSLLLPSPALPLTGPRAVPSFWNSPPRARFSHGYMSFLLVIFPICPQIPALEALFPAVSPSSVPTPQETPAWPPTWGAPHHVIPLLLRRQWGACHLFWGASVALRAPKVP